MDSNSNETLIEQAEEFRANMIKIHEIGIRLSEQKNLDDVYKQCVQQALLNLPFLRMALILYDPEIDEMQGTWGTDENGHLKDEHDFQQLLSKNGAYDFIKRTLSEKYFVSINENITLFNYGKPVGQGWSAMVGLWHNGEVIGWLAVDNLLDGANLGFFDRDLLAIYAQAVSSCIIRKQYEIELQEANQSLEIRVEKRTHALNNKINELYQTQQKLIESEKLASLGQMAAGVAHEINNPMGYISSNLDTLNEYVTQLKQEFNGNWASLNENQQNELDFILSDMPALISESINGGVRVKDIVKGLKLFARSSDDLSTAIDINDVLEQTLIVVNNEIKYHCQVTKKLTDLPSVNANVSKMIQVFTNLIINASHANPDNCQIIIETWFDEKSVYASISDNGHGVENQHLDQIFNPFFTTKPVGEGTGLGLSISYGIVREFGGSIEVNKPPYFEQGAQFVIILPILPAN